MIKQKETVFTKDLENKKMKVVREFDAPVGKVWEAWTDHKILDKWWAPKPWKAGTVSMDFREGGRWRYYMEGPEGEKHYCIAEYRKIVPKKSFEVLDAFTDDQGNINTEFPRMNWLINFIPVGDATRVDVEINFDSVEDLNKIVEMGFKEGFTAAHQNLDELLG
jgi:uncharacterized protein YndB with AHSA1/START domain